MKILLIGSGPDRFGKAGELDCLAVQGRRWLVGQGHQLVWLDSNHAAIMSRPVKGCRVYLEPLDLGTIARVIERERPQALMYDFGGRLAQHLTLFLEREGVLDRLQVRVLGMPVSGLRDFMDEETQYGIMQRLGMPVLQAAVGRSFQEGLTLANQLGFPLLIKPALALEGMGGRLLFNQDEAVRAIRLALYSSPVREIVLQKLPRSWRLAGVESLHMGSSPGTAKLLGSWEAQHESVEKHPGNVLLRSPAQNLSNELCRRVLDWSASLASETALVGCLRLELAIAPHGEELQVLRVRPGVSRLSAWLGLLGGMSLGRLVAGAALGLSREEMTPTDLLPMQQVRPGIRLPLEFIGEESQEFAGPTLQAVGAIVKVEPDRKTAITGGAESLSLGDGDSEATFPPSELTRQKESDRGAPQGPSNLIPCCVSGEGLPWWFMGGADKCPPPDRRDPNWLLILGPGPYRIGWGAEVDTALWHTARSLKDLGKSLVLINNNPDAASMDTGVFCMICLEAPSSAAIAAALDRWPIGGVIHQFCPEICPDLDRVSASRGVEILGTSLTQRRRLTDWRFACQALLELGVPLRGHAMCDNPDELLGQAHHLGFPILARLTDTWLNPAGEIVRSPEELPGFIRRLGRHISGATPLYMEKFQEGIVGAQLLALADGQRVSCLGLVENIEDYGVHSGDCAATITPLSIGEDVKASALRYMEIIAGHFGVVGHFKLELAVEDGRCYVSNVWPFPSQNLALADKQLGYDPYALTAEVLTGGGLESEKINEQANGYLVKEAVFPFQFLPGTDPALSPGMRSTGQVLGRDCTIGKAFYKAQLADNPELPEAGCVFISVRNTEKKATLNICRKLLDMGFQLMSTQGTAHFLRAHDLLVKEVSKLSEGRPNIVDMMKNGEVVMAINIPGGLDSKQDEAMIRLAAVERNLPLFTTIAGASLMVEGMAENRRGLLELSPLDDDGQA
jgi:carbamoyl-phosphate synthase large subunit